MSESQSKNWRKSLDATDEMVIEGRLNVMRVNNILVGEKIWGWMSEISSISIQLKHSHPRDDQRSSNAVKGRVESRGETIFLIHKQLWSEERHFRITTVKYWLQSPFYCLWSQDKLHTFESHSAENNSYSWLISSSTKCQRRTALLSWHRSLQQ